jgi:hypothetical protein
MLKSAICGLTLLYSSMAFSFDFIDLLFQTNSSSDYELQTVSSSEIDQHMTVALSPSDIPERLQGLWWLDGNPVNTSILMSFGKGEWDPIERTISMPVYGENIWAWEASEEGQSTYDYVLGADLVYELQLNEDLTEGVVIPFITIAGFTVRVPDNFFTIGLRFVEDGYWIRDTYLFGKKVHEYDFRRIISPEGEREAAFQEFLETAPEQLAIAKRTN